MTVGGFSGDNLCQVKHINENLIQAPLIFKRGQEQQKTLTVMARVFADHRNIKLI